MTTRYSLHFSSYMDHKICREDFILFPLIYMGRNYSSDSSGDSCYKHMFYRKEYRHVLCILQCPQNCTDSCEMHYRTLTVASLSDCSTHEHQIGAGTTEILKSIAKKYFFYY